jgi:hypothetical protein
LAALYDNRRILRNRDTEILKETEREHPPQKRGVCPAVPADIVKKHVARNGTERNRTGGRGVER